MDKEPVMSHVLSSETGTVVQSFDASRGYRTCTYYVKVRCRGLPESEDTLEPIAYIYKEVPQLCLKRFRRKPPHLMFPIMLVNSFKLFQFNMKRENEKCDQP